MRIEHVAMYVNDLEAAKNFFEKYLGASANEGYHNKTTDFRSYFLTFDDGARLEIMNRPYIADRAEGFAEGYVHMALSLGSREAVDSLTQRLKTDGIKVKDGPRVTGDGYYESTVLDPDGNIIELTV